MNDWANSNFASLLLLLRKRGSKWRKMRIKWHHHCLHCWCTLSIEYKDNHSNILFLSYVLCLEISGVFRYLARWVHGAAVADIFTDGSGSDLSSRGIGSKIWERSFPKNIWENIFVYWFIQLCKHFIYNGKGRPAYNAASNGIMFIEILWYLLSPWHLALRKPYDVSYTLPFCNFKMLSRIWKFHNWNGTNFVRY